MPDTCPTLVTDYIYNVRPVVGYLNCYDLNIRDEGRDRPLTFVDDLDYTAPSIIVVVLDISNLYKAARYRERLTEILDISMRRQPYVPIILNKSDMASPESYNELMSVLSLTPMQMRQVRYHVCSIERGEGLTDVEREISLLIQETKSYVYGRRSV